MSVLYSKSQIAPHFPKDNTVLIRPTLYDLPPTLSLNEHISFITFPLTLHYYSPMGLYPDPQRTKDHPVL